MASSSDSSAERQQQLEQVLAEYLRGVEEGRPVAQQTLLDQHPELADELRSFFRNRAEMARLALTLQAAAEDTPTIGLGGAQQAATNGTRIRYFGDYELVAEIARGGMGVVYRARQVSLNRPVALKMILAGQLAADDDVRRFKQEAEGAANLDHPNIVPIYEIGEQAGQHYFSMKLIEGCSLAQRLRDPGGRPSERDAAHLMATVARAVHHAHQRGLLHRDLKPGNILFDAAGEPHVTDFGLAKRVEGESDLTHSGAIIGTPSYMSPEQASGEKNLTTGCDTFSLGAILYELLTGAPPFRGATPMETVLNVLANETPRPSAVNPLLDRDIETIALKCLEKAPSQRYDSAAALADDLDRWLRGEPIAARPVTSTEQFAKWVWRNPALAGLWGALAIAVLAVVGLGISASYQGKLQEAYDQELASRAAAEDATKRANLNAERAERSESRVQDVFYAADMSLAHHQWDQTNLPRMRMVLARHEPAAGAPDRRGFEWHYLSRLAHLEDQVLHGHEQPVSTVTFAQEGQTLLSCCRADVWNKPAVVRRWNLARPEDSRVLWTQSRAADATYYRAGGRLAAAPHGTCVAVLNGTQIRILDIESGNELLVLPGHDKNINAMTMSADGGTLATGIAEGEIRLWNVATGEETARFASPSVEVICFSPDGEHLLAGSGELKLWEVKDAKPVGDFGKLASRATAAAFSPDGKSLATGHRDGLVRVWTLATREMKRELRGHTLQVTGVAYAREGSQIVSASDDATIQVWESATGTLAAIHKGHESKINALTLAPDGTTFATASRDSTVRTWRLGHDPARAVLGNQSWALNSLACTADSQTLMVADYTNVRIYDARTLELRKTWETKHWNFRALLSPNGKIVATSGNRGDGGQEPGIVKLWNLPEGTLRATLDPHFESVQGIEFSADGRLIVANGWHRQPGITAWNVDDGKEAGHWREAIGASFCFDSQTLALSSERDVRLWDRRSKETRTLDLGPRDKLDSITAIQFSPREPRLAISWKASPAELWNIATGQRQWRHADSATSDAKLQFAPNGKTLAIVGASETLLCDVAKGETRGRITVPPSRCAFTADNCTLITTAGEVQLWQAETGQHMLDLGGYGGFEITCLTVSPDNGLIAVAGGWRDENAGVYVWQAK